MITTRTRQDISWLSHPRERFLSSTKLVDLAEKTETGQLQIMYIFEHVGLVLAVM
jgi:hypothetical protein